MEPIMTQSSALTAALAGAVIGAMFFTGQWLTLWLCHAHPRYRFWQGMSGLFRTGLALSGIYWFGAQSWQMLIFCLIGFVTAYGVVRVVLNALPEPEPPPAQKPKRSHLIHDPLPRLLPARPGRLARAEKQIRKELQAQAMQQDHRIRPERRTQNERRSQAERRLQANRRNFPDRRTHPERRGQADRRDQGQQAILQP